MFKHLAKIVSILFFLLLSFTLFNLGEFNNSIATLVEKNIAITGVSHDVTAVLLYFRSLDTLLEIGVITFALFLFFTITPLFKYYPTKYPSKVIKIYTHFMFPVIVIGGFYILWSGSFQSGGAFQGGALIAGGVILLYFSHPDLFQKIPKNTLTFTYFFGFFVFILVGLLTLFQGNFLEYPKNWSYFSIVTIETSLTLSLGMILASFFIQAVREEKL